MAHSDVRYRQLQDTEDNVEMLLNRERAKRMPKPERERLARETAAGLEMAILNLDSDSDTESDTLYGRGDGDDEGDDEGDEAVPEAATADDDAEFQREARSMLSRIIRRLKESASNVWHKVCEACSAIFNFLKSIFCSCVSESRHSAAFSKLHVA